MSVMSVLCWCAPWYEITGKGACCCFCCRVLLLHLFLFPVPKELCVAPLVLKPSVLPPTLCPPPLQLPLLMTEGRL